MLAVVISFQLLAATQQEVVVVKMEPVLRDRHQ